MKLISALSKSAPAPLYRVNRAPANLPPLSKSRIPSLSPISLCSLGVNIKFGRLPAFLISTLSSVVLPEGTDGCGILGRFSKNFSSISSFPFSPSSSSFISDDTCCISSRSRETSFFSFFSVAISSDAAFLLCFNLSTSAINRLLSSSSILNSGRPILPPLTANLFSTSVRFSLKNLISSIIQLQGFCLYLQLAVCNFQLFFTSTSYTACSQSPWHP